MWTLYNNADEPIYRTETDAQTCKSNKVSKGKAGGWDKLGVWD